MKFTSRSALNIALSIPALVSVFAIPQVQAADWSDTSVSWRIGNAFREPFNATDIQKNVIGFTHVSGYKYGTNFLNVDLLLSDSNDPGSLNQKAGAQEAYVIYRHTLDLAKATGQDMKMGAVQSVGLTVGFDWNAKNDVGYNSRKRMLVLGPTLMWAVKGHLNTSLVLLVESNAPSGAFPPISNVKGRYQYKVHPMLAADWSIPLSESSSFDGFLNYIASKGVDEVGQETGVETLLDLRVMWDLASALNISKNTLRVGVEYQYWNNKFGNTSATTGGKGYRASTPMLRAEYHF